MKNSLQFFAMFPKNSQLFHAVAYIKLNRIQTPTTEKQIPIDTNATNCIIESRRLLLKITQTNLRIKGGLHSI
jgi:hypothetical protein